MIKQYNFPVAIFFVLFFIALCSPTLIFSAGGGGGQGAPIESAAPCIPGEPCLITPETPGATIFRERWKNTDDPTKDGWDTEVFNNQANKQLKKIGKIIVDPETIDEYINEFIDNDYSSKPLLPTSLITVFEDKVFTVKRVQPNSFEHTLHKGTKGFSQAIKDLAKVFQDAEDLHFKFKLFRVRKIDNYIITDQYFALSGQTEKGMLEHNATWRITWRNRKESLPVVVGIEVESFEEVALIGGKLLRDSTESVLSANKSYEEQILRGYPESLGAIENTLEFSIFGTPGLALGDVNNDGLDDIYICQEQGLPNRLYIQQKDGTAVDRSAEAGVDWLESSRNALFLDLDNDQDQDLVVTMPGALVLAENDGSGHFTIKNIFPIGDDPMSLTGTDYDLDGDIDLYVALYNPDRHLEKTEAPAMPAARNNFVYHDANNGPGNILFRNDIIPGDKWPFTNVTAGSGLDVNNSRFSLAAAWEDYDNDGDQDLYVANDYGRDNLYRNDTPKGGKPQFVDVSATAEIEDSAGSMAITWGDYNRDGLMDAFVSAMWSSAGNRITFQENFKNDAKDVKTRLQQFARGNTLLQNKGNGSFSDQSSEAGVEMGRWAWSSNFADLNNDGWEDLVVANGFLTGDQKGGDL